MLLSMLIAFIFLDLITEYMKSVDVAYIPKFCFSLNSLIFNSIFT